MTDPKSDAKPAAGAGTPAASGSPSSAASGSASSAASGSASSAASGSVSSAASGSVGGKCPICGKPAIHAMRPFCSSRCADIDLGRWVSGAYVIAGGQSDADEDGDEAFARDVDPRPAAPGTDREPQ